MNCDVLVTQYHKGPLKFNMWVKRVKTRGPERIPWKPGSVSSLATTNPPALNDSAEAPCCCSPTAQWVTAVYMEPVCHEYTGKWRCKHLFGASKRVERFQSSSFFLSLASGYVSLACAAAQRRDGMRVNGWALPHCVCLQRGSSAFSDWPSGRQIFRGFPEKLHKLSWSRARLWAVWTSVVWPAPCRWSPTRSWPTSTTWVEGASAPCSRHSTRTGGPPWPSSALSSTPRLEKGNLGHVVCWEGNVNVNAMI